MAGYNSNYDIIVIGAGHAGCEAALVSAKMGMRVLLLAIDLDKLAAMPCSPSIGGMAKGQLVKEIDALGGEMAKASDKSAIQYRTLNTKKGPAVHSTRTQNDKIRYQLSMKMAVESQENLYLKQALVEKLLIEGKRVVGIEDNTGFCYMAPCVIVATGTFLSGLIHMGEKTIKAGRAGEFASYELPSQMRGIGFNLGRMKTGTPPRLSRSSIDFSKFTEHQSDESPKPFSFSNSDICMQQIPSFIGYTNEKTHAIARDNIQKSALYSGKISGVSARYCPSFEDKIIKFPDRDRHQIILEPEGLDTQEIYVSGFGNSMPLSVQIEIVRSVPGLEQAEIMRPGYAIEYDYINPMELKLTLETRRMEGLFFAGQVIGTSGYEEAAALGMWAGINAACKVQKREPFILDRSEGYMGVMVDDLVTRGTIEPYRMFTSRAEYRLMLREDNADLRLADKSYELGIMTRESLDRIHDVRHDIATEITRIKSRVVKPTDDVNRYLADHDSNPINNGTPLDQLLKRAGMGYDLVQRIGHAPDGISKKVIRQVEIEIKYEGYIKRQLHEIEKFKNLEKIRVHDDFDYSGVHGLSAELKEKLEKLRPSSLGQVSRLDGITPAAISVLMISLKAHVEKIKKCEISE